MEIEFIQRIYEKEKEIEERIEKFKKDLEENKKEKIEKNYDKAFDFILRRILE